MKEFTQPQSSNYSFSSRGKLSNNFSRVTFSTRRASLAGNVILSVVSGGTPYIVIRLVKVIFSKSFR